jgi:hypothetical protein
MFVKPEYTASMDGIYVGVKLHIVIRESCRAW